jgi:hypothetical protein
VEEQRLAECSPQQLEAQQAFAEQEVALLRPLAA